MKKIASKKSAKPAKKSVSKSSAKKAAPKHEVHYVCMGNCMGLATEEHYKKGAKTCNVIVCSHYGKPLQARHYCKDCHMHYLPGKKHECFKF